MTFSAFSKWISAGFQHTQPTADPTDSLVFTVQHMDGSYSECEWIITTLLPLHTDSVAAGQLPESGREFWEEKVRSEFTNPVAMTWWWEEACEVFFSFHFQELIWTRMTVNYTVFFFFGKFDVHRMNSYGSSDRTDWQTVVWTEKHWKKGGARLATRQSYNWNCKLCSCCKIGQVKIFLSMMCETRVATRGQQRASLGSIHDSFSILWNPVTTN